MRDRREVSIAEFLAELMVDRRRNVVVESEVVHDGQVRFELRVRERLQKLIEERTHEFGVVLSNEVRGDLFEKLLNVLASLTARFEIGHAIP